MDPGDPDPSDSTYFFQDGFDWDVHTHDVLSGPALTQEQHVLMTDIPSNEFDILLKAYYQTPSSVPCEQIKQTQYGNEPEVASQDTPAFTNANDQVSSSVSYEQTQCGSQPKSNSKDTTAFTNDYEQPPSSVLHERMHLGSEPELTSQDAPTSANVFDQVLSSVSIKQAQLHMDSEPEFTSQDAPTSANVFDQVLSSVSIKQAQLHMDSEPEFTSQDAPVPTNLFDQVPSSVSFEQTQLDSEPKFTSQDTPAFANVYHHVPSSVPYEQTQLNSEPGFISQNAPMFTNSYYPTTSSVPYEQTEWDSQLDSIFQDTDADTELARLEHEICQLAAEKPDWTNPAALSFLENGASSQNDSVEPGRYEYVNFDEFIEPAFLQPSPVRPPGIMLPEPVQLYSSPVPSTGNMFAQPTSLQSTPVHHSYSKRLSEPNTLPSTPAHSIGNLLSDPIRLHSSPIDSTPIKSSNGTKSSTPRSANIDNAVFDSLKKAHAKVTARAKRTPKTPVSKSAASWAKSAYPFSRSPRPPSAARRALDSVTVTPDGITIDTPTPMRKRSHSSSTLSTPSKSHKRKNPVPEDPSPTSSRNKPYRYPESWDTASGEDILLFDMKNMDHSWKEITETFQRLTPHNYARTTLQNRYNKIKTRLGDMPKSLMADEVLKDVGSDLADLL